MGRQKKYKYGATNISLRVDNEILKMIDSKAQEVGMNRSEFTTYLYKISCNNDSEFCSLMARQAAHDLHYWKSRSESMKAIADDQELFFEIPKKVKTEKHIEPEYDGHSFYGEEFTEQ